MEGSWNIRNLAFQAGQSVAFGLPKEAALAAVTSSTAQILGIQDRVYKRKDATFIISKGGVLDMHSFVITDAFIEGRKVDLEDKQKVLYDRYIKKYDLKK